MEFCAKWIKPKQDMGDVCPVFRKRWECKKKLIKAELLMTAQGVYEAALNGKRVGDYVLAPGWTSYHNRLQYQIYNITKLIEADNELVVTVGKGWFRSPMPGFAENEEKKKRTALPPGLFGEVRLVYDDGTVSAIPTDAGWECGESGIRFSEIYDGEIFDAGFETAKWSLCEEFEGSAGSLILQEGEFIKEKERVAARSVLVTPSGETVVDFGQEVTGYVEFTVDAKAGEKVHILHGEVLDKDGNFYNANYRSARAEIDYTCREGRQTWHPRHTFFGFRYLKLERFPGKALPEQFTAVAVYSDIKRTGRLSCSDRDLNQLFSNIFWGQKGNFLDVPTDCPQRDERLGWTGDAQVFIKTASYNYDVERFFTKWLHDLAADQRENGGVSHVIPDLFFEDDSSAAWGDAAVICPWQIYLTYGNVQILREQFPSMKRWVDYITRSTQEQFLWIGGKHFGDWLGLDAEPGSYKGASRDDFVASAYYANSVNLLIKAGRVIGEDVAEYEELYRNIVETFRKTFTDYRTQTEHVLAVWFELAADPQKTADELAELIERDGRRLQTGFVGTPYLLHVLSKYGHTGLAYTLLLRKEYPSWLYPLARGATTIWEHWDGIGENGEMWSDDMNSFNHYSYGAVADWVYEEAAGIQPVVSMPGFAKVRIAPKPDKRLEWLEASIETRFGRIVSRWSYCGGDVRYEIRTPVTAQIVIGNREITVEPGRYTFWG